MTELTDGKAQAYTLAYTGDKLSSLTDPLGESLHFAYQTGQTAAVKKDAGENTVSTELTVYDSLGRATAETDADGNTTVYTYGSGAKQYLVTGTSRAGEWEIYDDATETISRQEVSLETGSVYNNDLNLVRQEEEDGTVTEYSYGQSPSQSEWNGDLPTGEEVSSGNTVTDFTENIYDRQGNLVTEVSSPSSTRNGHEVTTTNTYEDGNLETTFTEGDGQLSYSQYSYDADGNQTGENGKSGAVKTKESALYDEMGNVVSSETVNEENEPMQSEEYGYDYLGREVSCTVSAPGQDDRVTTKAYDANGSLIRETDGDGVVTEYTYDAANRVISREVTKGQDSVVRLFSYGYEEISIHTLSGSVTVPRAAYRTESDGNNTLISKTWSTASGRTLSEISGGVRTDYSYDASGNCIAECTYPATESDPDLFWTVSLYDLKGQQTGTAANASVNGNGMASVTADTAFTRTSYDEKGNVTQETDAMGTVTLYTYDDANRITQVTRDAGSNDPSITGAVYTVDDAVTETTVTDPLGDQKVEKTDAAGLVLETKDLDGDTGQHITTKNTYDADGNLTRILYEDGSRQDMAYNLAGLLTGKTSYDASGLETMQTLYDYDSKGRQVSMKDYRMEGGQERLFRMTATGYDAYGRTAWVSETDSTDGQDPSQSMINLHKISYSYDAEDRLVRKDYPLAGSGIRGLCYLYDGTGRLTEIKAVLADNTLKMVRSLEYDSLGRLSVTEDYPGLTGTSGTCIRRAYRYDVFDRITGIEYKKGNTLLEEYHYTYDKNGNITGKTEKNLTPSAQGDRTDRSVAYTYDAYGRLTGSTETDHNNGNAVTSVTYTYDKAGNRTGKTEGNKATTYLYNGLDQLTEAVTVSGVTELSRLTYTYDDNGNQTEEADSVSGRTVANTYDEENRLSGTVITEPQPVGDPIILTQTNSYNGDGQRVRKDEEGTVTRYFYEETGVSYTTGTSSAQKDLQYIRDLSGSVFLAQESGTISGPVTLHYDEDIQGSITSLLDTSGNGVASYTYDDFGETEMHGNLTLKNEVCYTSGIYDRLTGEYYLNARYYSPETGRFLTEDTYRGTIGNPESLHLYAYCANDPINSIDPSGNNPILLYYAYVALSSGTCVLVGTVWWNHHRTVIKGKKYLPSRIKLRSKSKLSIQNRIAVHIFTGLVYKHIYLSKSKKDTKTNNKKKSKASHKERADDIPSWAKGEKPKKGENGKKFAKRLLDERYGEGNWKLSRTNSEYSELKKYGDRFNK